MFMWYRLAHLRAVKRARMSAADSLLDAIRKWVTMREHVETYCGQRQPP